MRVPVQDGNLVQRGPGVGERLQSFDAGGDQVGRGLQAAGAGLANLSQGEANIAEIHDEAAAKEIDNSFVNHLNDTLHTGQDAFFSKRGKDALLASPDIQSGIKDYAGKLIDTAKSPLMKKMVTDVVNQRLNGALREIGDYTDNQTFEYNKTETAGRIATGSSAAVNAWDNPDDSERNIATVRSEAANYGRIVGLGDDGTKAYVQSKVSDARKGVAANIIAAGPDGPRVGQAYIDKYKDDFTGDDHTYLTHYVRSQGDYYEAQAHKVQVEARQEQRQQITDARQTVEDYISAAGVGPRPATETATALAAASKVEALTGNGGLRIRTAKIATENNTKVAYQNATPIELQNAINELAPKTRGDNPDPEAMTRYGTLTQMLSQTSKEVQGDPLSWGAKHMGLTVGRLDWNDPTSIQQRVQTAQTISARTGVAPKMLTNEEVGVLAPLAASHDVGQQKNLVFQLARLGPQYAAIAARQVAPNDDRLAALVGLANVPDAGVAQNLVIKALQGPEVIKAYPKIISKNFDGAFSDAIGDTLRLSPAAARGVKDLARSLLASNASAGGTHENADTSDAVKASINGALGAYNDHGVMRGGLGTHSGKPTILPTGMSQPEFDATIARSNAGAILGASNGRPVWSNGKRYSAAADLWALQMVPIGDGRYRFFNGSDYVAKEGGGFFELDVRRLRQ